MDVYQDKNFHQLYKILMEKPDLAPMVKQANFKPQEALQLPATCFAWPTMRMFRIDTPEHAAISHAYMEKTSSDIPEFVKDNLMNALAVFDIDVSQFEKQSSYGEDDYLFPDERRYLVVDEQTYKLAHEAMMVNFTRIPWSKRSKACIKLAQHARRMDLDMHPKLLREASLVSCDLTKLSLWLRERAHLATKRKQEKVAQAFDEMADGLHKIPSANRDELSRFTDAITQFDKVAGLEDFYDMKIPNPVATVYNTEKFAEATVSLAGKDIPITRILQLSPDYIGDVLGDDIIPEISSNGQLDNEKMQVVFRTLPLDMQRALVERLNLSE